MRECGRSCDLNFVRSPSRCALIPRVRFFPFHLIFNGRAYIRGLCGGGYYSTALNTRGPSSCSLRYDLQRFARCTGVRIRATLKSRFAESQVGQRRRFSAGEIIPVHKSVFLRSSARAGHYCFPNPVRARSASSTGLFNPSGRH